MTINGRPVYEVTKPNSEARTRIGTMKEVTGGDDDDGGSENGANGNENGNEDDWQPLPRTGLPRGEDGYHMDFDLELPSARPAKPSSEDECRDGYRQTNLCAEY